MAERLTPREITSLKQSLETSCVPASIAMVFSGFGIDISEQSLVERYFQTARQTGVSNPDMVRGIVQIIEDMGLEEALQFDVFIPDLWQCVGSTENKCIVIAQPRAITKYARMCKKGSNLREFAEALEQLAKAGKINVYTPNGRVMQFSKNYHHWYRYLPKEAYEQFYAELSDFISKGHIVGPHGGLTMHMRALDGSRMERISPRYDDMGYVIVDPRGESYAVSLQSLVIVDSFGARGDIFDYLFRVSPRESVVQIPKYGFRKLINKLRGYKRSNTPDN